MGASQKGSANCFYLKLTPRFDRPNPGMLDASIETLSNSFDCDEKGLIEKKRDDFPRNASD